MPTWFANLNSKRKRKWRKKEITKRKIGANKTEINPRWKKEGVNRHCWRVHWENKEAKIIEQLAINAKKLSSSPKKTAS